MHLLRTESRDLEEPDGAVDLGQTPGEVVALSFSDSDLGALAAACEGRGGSYRLASLAQLKHPYSVDLHVERVVGRARFVLVRLLGGMDYWRYGVEECARVARARGIPLAIVPGDARADPRLDAASTLPADELRRIWRWFSCGGVGNINSLLGYIDARLGRPAPWTEPVAVPPAGRYVAGCRTPAGAMGTAAITFYRAMVLAGDCAPVVALADALAARGLAVVALYATSLKDAEAAAILAERVDALRPDVIVNLTGFSGRGDEAPSVLDRADAPVLQAILAGGTEAAWRGNPRGLGPADLAMNVVLPEMDGRLIAPAISAKAELPRSAATEFTRLVHRPIPDRIAAVADLAANWAALRRTAPGERRVAMVLSDYPGRGGREGYAVGLDTPGSVAAICADLREAGYDVGPLPEPLMAALKAGKAATDLAATDPAATAGAAPFLPLATYRAMLAALPPAFTASLLAHHGDPGDDPALVDGAFPIRALRLGKLVLALQPDRGGRGDRKAAYHDATRPPGHGYVGFYLWLRHRFRPHALVHCGTHGTLEWLPGKPVAPAADCAPEVLLGPTPLIYPFIVNNPGEAAQAKRRSAALTLGHLTPPLVEAGPTDAALELETLFDEYAAAETLDPRRAALVARTLVERAAETGLARDAGVDLAQGRDALAALDGWLCDVKEMRIRDGLHTFGRGTDAACAEGERRGLLAALDGRFVPGGPAGAPSRGRSDVLPTGRNIYGTDPRAVPSRTAYAIGSRAAALVAERFAQDHGDWPRHLVLDLWASSTMRTAGEDVAQALAHLGVAPRWDHASARVGGFTVLPHAALDRPRADVTLRVSGLFRDVFPGLIALFDQAARAVAALDEEDEINPLAAARRRRGGENREGPRVFGSAPGTYGTGIGGLLDTDPSAGREELGRRYLAGASHGYGGPAAEPVAAAGGFADRVAAADAFVHAADMADADTLDAAASVEAEGGFAAAARALGTAPALYHLDAGTADRQVVRTQGEEIARVVRGRAANPRWVAGQMRHGHRGAAEIAETVDNLHAMAVMSDAVASRHFDLVFAATCGDEAVRLFLERENPDAARAVAARFRDAATRGLWTSRRNSDAAILAGMLA